MQEFISRGNFNSSEDSGTQEPSNADVQRRRLIEEFKEKVRLGEQGEAIKSAIQYLRTDASRFLNDMYKEVLFEELSQAAEMLSSLSYEQPHPEALYSHLGMTQEGLRAIEEVARGTYLAQKYREASALYLLLTTLNGVDAAYWHRLGIALQEAGEYSKAFSAYSVAHVLDPTHIASYLYAAECCLNLHEIEKAEAEFREAKRLADMDPGREQWEEHLDLIEKLLHAA